MEQICQKVTKLIEQKRNAVPLRFDEQTVRQLETEIASLEGTEDAFATASGAAAMLLAILSNAPAGEHILASLALGSSTSTLLTRYCDSMAIEVSFVDMRHRENLQQALQPNTTVILLETPTYDNLSLIDLRMIKQFANRYGLISMVDNTYATPQIQQPARYGIDLIIHSTAKYIGGSAEVTAGFICGTKNLLSAIRKKIRKDIPMDIHPYDAWLILQGVKTLPRRMIRHCQNAQKVAEFLASHPKVANVYYPGLPSHPQHHLVGTQMLMGGGTIVFELHATSPQVNEFINNLQKCQIEITRGDSETVVSHIVPSANKEHWVRLVLGLEHPSDIIADLRQAFEHIVGPYIWTYHRKHISQRSQRDHEMEQKQDVWMSIP